jgi:prepilin-type N-terminal cleavage/methylation domain-containing protein
MSRRIQGFTAVELLIAIVVGTLLFISAYQLYLNVIRQSQDATARSQASNAAYDLLRQYQEDPYWAYTPCWPDTDDPAMPSYSHLPNASAHVDITCPYNPGSPNLTKLTVTVTYTSNGQTQKVYRVLTTTPA